jgi:5-methylcytosine-specific restriction enzyme subunit McrC
LRNWLAEAISIVLTNTPGQLREDASFIVQLLASVWAQGFAEAARHGLPALRCDVATKGPTIRGRLDVAASLRSLALGKVVSIRSERSLNHAASDAIVAAYVALHRWLALPDEQWMPARTKELIGHLISVTGARPRTPTKAELARIRYTPITAGFASIAELSRQIANRQGLATNMDARSESQGVLLDVAELWEMYVLSILRKAASPWTVAHGSRQKDANRTLLKSDVNGHGMGTLIPDAILHAGNTIHAVADAKYKLLQPTAATPNGPQREDLYQVAAYLSRFASANSPRSWGVLIYPQLVIPASASPAEQFSPWSLNDGKKIVFTTLPHHSGDAVAKLRSLITCMTFAVRA